MTQRLDISSDDDGPAVLWVSLSRPPATKGTTARGNRVIDQTKKADDETLRKPTGVILTDAH